MIITSVRFFLFKIFEGRWNYAFWDQEYHKEIMIGEEQAIFNNWLEYVDFKKNKFYSVRELVMHPVFVKILVNVINEIRATGLIKEVFGKEVPIIVHNLEYYYDNVLVTRKVNDKELIKNFIKWYETL